MVKRSDGEGHIRFKDRLASFAELSGDPFDETTDEAFAEWMDLVNEGLVTFEIAKAAATKPGDFDLRMNVFDNNSQGLHGSANLSSVRDEFVARGA